MYHLQPIYQNFSVTVDAKEHKNNNGHLAHLGLHFFEYIILRLCL